MNKLTVKSARISYDNKYVIVTMEMPIQKQNIIAVVKGIKNLDGNCISEDYQQNVLVDDHTAPAISSFVAHKGSIGYDSVTVTFTEPVYSGKAMLANMPNGIPLSDVSGETVTLSFIVSGSSFTTIYFENLSDGINISKDHEVHVLPIMIESRHISASEDPNRPKITNVSYTRNNNGKVSSLVLEFNKGLVGDSGYSASAAITAFDKYDRPVYAEAVAYDQYNNRIPESGDNVPTTYVCYTSNPVKDGDNKIVFPIADGVNIYNGKYTFFFAGGLIWDSNFCPSEEKTQVIDFSK